MRSVYIRSGETARLIGQLEAMRNDEREGKRILAWMERDDENAPVDFDPIDDPMAQYLDDWSEEQRDYYLGTQKLVPETPEEKPALEESPAEKERAAEEAGDILDFKAETITAERKVISGVDFSQKAAPKPRPKKKPNLNL